jgi:hypothetical protein
MVTSLQNDRDTAIFDNDKAGREAASRIKSPAKSGVDYFLLPITSSDCVLEDLIPVELRDFAKLNGKIVETITIKKRPDGTVLDESIAWNKEVLANYFCENAKSADWVIIEKFIEEVVRSMLK